MRNRGPSQHGLTTVKALCVVGMSLFTSSAVAATYTVASPVDAETIEREIARCGPGDEVVIPDGTLRNLDQIDIPENIDGTADRPITLRPETPGGVIFTGTPAESRMIQVNADWWVIDGFQFIDVSKHGAANTRGIFTTNATGTRVTNCYFQGFGVSTDDDRRDWPIWIGASGGGSHSRVDHNTFDGNEAVHIVIKSSATDCRVDHNHLKNSLGGGENGHEGIFVGGDGAKQDVRAVVGGSCTCWATSSPHPIPYRPGGGSPTLPEDG